MQTISIHAPREGGDSSANRCRSCWIHFNPRPPRGGRRENANYIQGNSEISIHAPREGGDEGTPLSPSIYERFQSTPPARGATLKPWERMFLIKISIHAPREGGDVVDDAPAMPPQISIHAPREGGDLEMVPGNVGVLEFQSTPPARGATFWLGTLLMNKIFQSTPPARGATYQMWKKACEFSISIHAPREGGDVL